MYQVTYDPGFSLILSTKEMTTHFNSPQHHNNNKTDNLKLQTTLKHYTYVSWPVFVVFCKHETQTTLSRYPTSMHTSNSIKI